MLKIFSWNVNGIRAVLNKGALQSFISEYQPDILCLQEIKAKPNQVDYNFPGYKVFWNPATRPGYSGTATLISETDFLAKNVIHWPSGRTAPDGANLSAASGIYIFGLENQNLYVSETSVAVPEGRVQVLDLEKFYLVNVYTPNSKPDLSRLELRYKSWDPEFLSLLKELEKTKPVVTCGDFNAAHNEIDIARPKINHHSAGFTDEERQGITNLIKAGFVDTFRFLHPGAVRYTWWSHWGHARENNVGWRIDYFFVSGNLKAHLKSAEIYENVAGSDHCPVSIELDLDGEK
ncbi:exodeoxyribonuclease III [Candidatus Saccharibacteria bacterium]|nr:exodeoxyribonuclease III [Candidatus Saccharibacteria bacterium]